MTAELSPAARGAQQVDESHRLDKQPSVGKNGPLPNVSGVEPERGIAGASIPNALH